MNTSRDDLEVPSESRLLKDAQRRSGLTAADLAAASGMSVGAINIALNGVRYRSGQPRVAVPTDRTLVKLCPVLRISSDDLRAVGRRRAAELLDEAVGGEPAVTFSSDREAQAVAAGRAALARQLLAAFSTQELLDELERRDQVERDDWRQEGIDDAMDELRQEWGQP